MKLLLAPLPFPLWRIRSTPANRFRDICVPFMQSELTLLLRIIKYSIVAQLRGRYQSLFNPCDLIRMQEALLRDVDHSDLAGNLVLTRQEWLQLSAYVSRLVRESQCPDAPPIPGLRDPSLVSELLPLLYRLKMGATRITVHLWN